jgi:hypothetical protein
MLGKVIYQDDKGMPFLEFKAKYSKALQGQHGIYVIQSNLEQDVERSILKVGRSQGTIIARLSSYATQLGIEASSPTDQAGLRVLYVRTLPKKSPLITGKSITEVFEKQLLDYLKETYNHIVGRGVERFSIDVNVLFEMMNTFKIDAKLDEDEFVRRSERLGGGERLMWLTFDSMVVGKTYLNFHPDFDELIHQHRAQVRSKFSAITAGMIPPKQPLRPSPYDEFRTQQGVKSKLRNSMENMTFPEPPRVQTIEPPTPPTESDFETANSEVPGTPESTGTTRVLSYAEVLSAERREIASGLVTPTTSQIRTSIRLAEKRQRKNSEN